MKKISIAVILFLSVIGSSFGSVTKGVATGVTGKAVPDFKGSDNFKMNFPQATDVVCKFKGQFTEVNFKWNDMQLQAFYDKEGNPIATCRSIQFNSLPVSLQTNFKKEYSGFVPTEVSEFDDANDGLCYYLTASNGEKTYMLHIAVTGSIYVFKKMKN
jgi:hypothetical protein